MCICDLSNIFYYISNVCNNMKKELSTGIVFFLKFPKLILEIRIERVVIISYNSRLGKTKLKIKVVNRCLVTI